MYLLLLGLLLSLFLLFALLLLFHFTLFLLLIRTLFVLGVLVFAVTSLLVGRLLILNRWILYANSLHTPATMLYDS